MSPSPRTDIRITTRAFTNTAEHKPAQPRGLRKGLGQAGFAFQLFFSITASRGPKAPLTLDLPASDSWKEENAARKIVRDSGGSWKYTGFGDFLVRA